MSSKHMACSGWMHRRNWIWIWIWTHGFWKGVKDVESKKEREKKARNEEKKIKEKRKKQGEEEERGMEFGR
jgi:hypothetical protein